MGTYSSLSGIFASSADWMESFGSFYATLRSLAYSLMNLVHIGSSYESYKYLSAGNAIALYYIHPFINILGGYLFLNEAIKWQMFPLFFIAFAGVLLISYAENKKDDDKKNSSFGIFMALLSALTESLIYFVVKGSEINSPFSKLLQLYALGFLSLSAYSGVQGFKDISGKPNEIGTIILFNIFIGFFAYVIRFYAIPLLDVSVYSILTFIGVATGYLWGLLFVGETPSALALLGAGCISGSVFFLDNMRGKKI
jgi:drug/metabolite transporter (DMT)-like permease